MFNSGLRKDFSLIATIGFFITALTIAFGLGALTGLSVLMMERAEWRRLEGELVVIRNHQRHLWGVYEQLLEVQQQRELAARPVDLRVPGRKPGG